MDSYTVVPKILSSSLLYVSEYEHKHPNAHSRPDRRSGFRFVCPKCGEVYAVYTDHGAQVSYFGKDHIPTYGLKRCDCPRCSGIKVFQKQAKCGDVMWFSRQEDAEKWFELLS